MKLILLLTRHVGTVCGMQHGFARLRVALRALATPRQARTKVCGDFPQIDPIIVFSTLCAFQVGMNVLDSAAQPQ